jgi:glutamyl-tRNA(Gln) amidotransferase subunit E
MLDYKKLGFKAGIEIHQELDTGKLFCECSSDLRETDLVSEVRRKIRAVAGETGSIDLASSYEQFRDRDFIYHGYKDEFCLVDLDEEPPHPVNRKAFDIALAVAKLFRLKVPDTLCVMRKTVTDGSAVSGFQRTMLAGIESPDSNIETSKGLVKIMQLNLEEDACKIEEKKNSTVSYSLSRLGIPLLEIGTDASLKDPQHVYETALMIGTMLRSFNVKRGLGTIRQDVNVSIKGGSRIEVKGWQDLKKLSLLVENEVLRQHNLLEIKNELEARSVKKFRKNIIDATKIFQHSHNKMIHSILQDKGVVYSLMLPGFSRLLKREVCPGKTFGRELSEYAKAYETKGMIHTDEDLNKYDLIKEFDELRELFKAKSNDLIIVIAEKKEIAQKASDAVYERAIYCLTGIPEETRIPNHFDATSSYARPLPGAHRLYPETDIPNIDVNQSDLKKIKLPELIIQKAERFQKEYKIEKALAAETAKEGYDIDSLAKHYKNVEPRFIAYALIEIPKEIKKRYNVEINSEDSISEILQRLNKDEISKDAVLEIMLELGQGKKVDYEKYKILSTKELEEEIKNIIRDNKGIPMNALIGKVMERLRGKAEGKKIVEAVKRLSGQT